MFASELRDFWTATIITNNDHGHSHRVELCIVECRESLYSLKTMITLLLLLLLASNIPFSFGQKVSVDYDKFMVHMRNNRKKTLLENK